MARDAKAVGLAKEAELRQQIDKARKVRPPYILVLVAIVVIIEVFYTVTARLQAIEWLAMGGLIVFTLVVGFWLLFSARDHQKKTIANLESEREKARALTSEYLQKLKAEYTRLKAQLISLQRSATPSGELMWKRLQQET